MKTLVVAEAGVNHNGDLETALRLVDAASEAGADVVKFQTFSADRLATAAAPTAAYQAAACADQAQRTLLRRLELTRSMHEALIARCAERGIEFLSTPFDLESADMLAALGLQRFKIPSGEITNLPLLRRIAGLGRSILLSTGMCTLDEVGQALDALARAGAPRGGVTVLQCTTAYPAPVDDANLRAMLTIRDTFGVTVGYSDHTRGTAAALAAVAIGAAVIEKHFTLDRRQEGPDHQASLEPHELAAMVDDIRSIERAMGDGVKRPAPGEAANMPVVRKSLVAACAIRAGERFTERNVTSKRPGTGISPMRWDDVIGRAAHRDFVADEMIEL
jgi:N,N'-diacetyllegionaminate synthase